MIKLLKVIAWFLFFASLAAFAYLALGGTHGHLTVTVNGQHVEGAQKLLIGSFGFLIAAVAMLVSLGFAALALASSGLLVFGALALTALVLIAVAIPFLLPLVIPIIIVAFVLMLCRQSQRSNRA